MKKFSSLILIVSLVLGFSLLAYAAASNRGNMLIISTTDERFRNWKWEGKGGRGADYRLIWSEKTAEAFLERVAAPVKDELKTQLDKIDFAKNVAIVAYLGEMPTTGYRVKIGQVSIVGQTVLIDIGMMNPHVDVNDRVTAPTLDYPFDLVILPRTDIPGGEINYKVVNQHGTVWVNRWTTINKAPVVTSKPSKKRETGQQENKKKEKETNDVYTVRTGDTLWALAQRFHTTIETLLKLNPGLNPNELHIGQKIRVNGPVVLPVPVATKGVHIVRTGESLWSIANDYEVTVEQLVKWNRLSDYDIRAGQGLRIQA
ncbi:MAG: LysM peptidoglycan-binding domain-containing protein [Limnochordia bacterium]